VCLFKYRHTCNRRIAVMMKQTRRTFATIAILAASAGTTALVARAQTAAQEVFQLVTVAGQPLPVLLEEDGDCREELLSATLTLETDGRWVLATNEREVCGNDTETDEDQDDGTYAVEGQSLRFLNDDGDAPDADDDDDDEDIEVDELATGTRSGGDLVVRLADGSTDLQFRLQ
jgi:hypothetical protein